MGRSLVALVRSSLVRNVLRLMLGFRFRILSLIVGRFFIEIKFYLSFAKDGLSINVLNPPILYASLTSDSVLFTELILSACIC